jgi:hypothetical protein
MKIDHIIFSSSEVFSPYWNLQSQIWKTKFGIKPLCLLFGDKKKCGMSEEYGEVYEMQAAQHLPPVLQITCSKFLAFDLLPFLDRDKTYMIGDIDLFPLQTDWFTKNIEGVSNDSYLHLSLTKSEELSLTKFGSKADFTGPGAVDMCGYYHVAKGTLYNELFNQGTFLDTVAHIVRKNCYGLRVKVLNENIHGMGDIHDAYWCAEETYTTQMIRNALLQSKLHLQTFGYLDKEKRSYIDRDSWRYCNDAKGWNNNDYIYDEDRLRNGEYIDIHCRRPYAQQEQQLIRVLKIANMI